MTSAVKMSIATGVLFVAVSLTASVLNHLYLIFSGRILSAEEFGQFYALASLLSLTGILGSALQSSTNLRIAQTPPARRGSELRRAVIMALCLGGIAGGAFSLSPVRALLGISASDALALVFGAGSLLVFSCLLGATIASARTALAASMLITVSGLKFLAGWFFALRGLGAFGAVTAYGTGWLAGILVLSSVGPWRREPDGEAPDAAASPAAPPPLAFFTTLLISAPILLDIIFVRVLIPAESSAFAAVAAGTKLIFYSGAPVIQLFIRRFAVLPARDGNSRAGLRVLAQALASVLAVAVPLASLGVFFPSEFLSLLFGAKYPEASQYVPELALATLFLTACLPAAFYLVAIGFVWLPAYLVVGLLCQAGLFWFAGADLAGIVRAQCVVLVIQSVLVWAAYGHRALLRVVLPKRN